MKHLIITFLTAFALILGTPIASAQQTAPEFLSIVPDLPLMPGLYEIEELSMSFDKPEGRIVVAEAEGNVKTEAVFEYYAKTLPQLGWTQDKYNEYLREGEILTITPITESRILQVKFFVKPQ